jgi:DNA-binding MarR family transcriptional regulator
MIFLLQLQNGRDICKHGVSVNHKNLRKDYLLREYIHFIIRTFLFKASAWHKVCLIVLVLCGTILYRIGGELLKDETQGGFLISQIKQISARIFEKLLASAGVEAFNGAQGRILYVLWQGDGIPIVELSKKTGLAKTTLTSMLDRMENANLISRVFDKADRRQIRIVLTETARELSDEYNRVSREMSEIYYAGFSDDEIAAFEAALRHIIKNLNERENQV